MPFLTERRIELNLSQQQLAERVGVHQSTISYYERGGGISPKRLQKLTAALDLDPISVARLVSELGTEADSE